MGMGVGQRERETDRQRDSDRERHVGCSYEKKLNVADRSETLAIRVSF